LGFVTMTPDDAYLASPKAIDDLRAINARFIDNFINNDVAAHDALLHPDFIAIRSDGTRVGRADYLKAWARGFDPGFIVYWDTRDELITVVGNVALVRATNKHVLRHPCHDETGMTVYTDTYVHERGAWTCIQAQSTPVAIGKEPDDETVISAWVEGVRTL
jgi:ketosteroid isomerase-like protein